MDVDKKEEQIVEAADAPKDGKREQPLIPRPKIVKVVTNDGGTFLLSDTGRVWFCGMTNHGLARLSGEEGEEVLFPEPISLPRDVRIVDLSAGDSHCAFLSVDGKVYLSGRTSSGQLAMFPESYFKCVVNPVLLPTKHTIQSVSVGSAQTLFLTTEGLVYSCGGNYNNQLGLRQSKQGTDVYRPQLMVVMAHKKVRSVVVGPGHSTFLITEGGEVYSCGSGARDQLGYELYGCGIVPQKVAALSHENIVQVVSRFSFTIFLAESGAVYMAGDAHIPGLVNSPEPPYIPRMLERICDEQIVQVAAEDLDFLSTNIFYLTKSGKVYITEKDQAKGGPVTRLMEDIVEPVAGIAGGKGHVAFLTRGGDVLTFGKDVYGQLGHGDGVYCAAPKRIEHFVAESEHESPEVEKARAAVLSAAQQPDEIFDDIGEIEQAILSAAETNQLDRLKSYQDLGGSIGPNVLHMAVRKAPVDDLQMLEWLISQKGGGIPVDSRCSQDETPFLTAAKFGKLPVLIALQAHGADVHAFAQAHRNAVHMASVSNSPAVLAWLAEQGLAVDEPDEYGLTPLLHASTAGDVSTLKWFKEVGASFDTTYEGLNVLHYAVKYGDNWDVVDWLVHPDGGGFDIDSRTSEGETAFMLAIDRWVSEFSRGDLGCLKRLKGCGAQSGLVDNNGDNALHRAIDRRVGRGVFEWLISDDGGAIDIESQRADGSTPLLFAARYGVLKYLEVLKSHQADMTAVDNDGDNAVVLSLCNEECPLEVVEWLFDKSGGNFDVNYVSHHGVSAFCRAAYSGQLEIAQHLKLTGAKTDTIDADGDDVLHCAADAGQSEVIDWLLSPEPDGCGMGIASRGNNGMTAVLFAAKGGHVDTLNVLLRRGADIHTCDEAGNSALHLAAQEGHLATVEWLLAHGVDETMTNTRGQSALDCTIAADQQGVVEFLSHHSKKRKIDGSQSNPSAMGLYGQAPAPADGAPSDEMGSQPS